LTRPRRPKKSAPTAVVRRDLVSIVAAWDLPAIAAAVAAMRQLNRPLRTDEASFYLGQGAGYPLSAGELANMRVTGGGPLFHRAGRWPVYTIEALDAYASERLGPALRTTSSRAASAREATA
jgi:hypothetical protein